MLYTEFAADKNKLTVRRTFNASINLVWRTWTEAELLDQWWAPKPWRSQTKFMNFKEQGSRLYAMLGPAGEEHWGLTDYLSINTHKNFTGKDSFCDNQGKVNNNLPIAEFTVHFSQNINQTVVNMTTHYASEEHLKQIIQMGMKEGLSMAFENLDKVLISLHS
jgi:uncharacterized protein YndB with AHSA1/START domain